ncbi:MAG: 50S ribosomal protein L21 [Leptonema illini]|jgi:large subunit ribosomal protein L21|uniref:Large ribosomal subunit protein bL21 n=2 Tax=Leptonema illini TaxID=183 RepID=H2CBY2_9LEPT|nr:50S ribosomal protein L21 [Leptonema illini]EHQ08654.1 LSU ribosomal protein L21P [Leptonema illini DSM 21528]KAB2930715.1 MAG: 50S ribosomal protein L21 [Leptonema illini]PKL30861.1 MAG: 50S ribosomal protein L21 [Spirochaetae bacterium HGW-Spirochaetae-10]
MFAIVELAGKQHKITKDQIFLSERTGKEPGETFQIEQVLLAGEGAGVKVGKPFVSGASVKVEVLADIRGPKVHGFKYKKKTGYKTSWGHRQDLQKLKVVEIKA